MGLGQGTNALRALCTLLLVAAQATLSMQQQVPGLVSILDQLTGIGGGPQKNLTQVQYQLLLESLRVQVTALAVLEGALGNTPSVDGVYKNGKWQNWGVSIKPRTLLAQNTFRPRTVGEVQQAVVNAVKGNKRVRCVGHAHTWTPVFFDEAAVANTTVLFTGDMTLQNGQRIELVRKADQALGQPAQVKVAAGVTTGELGAYFEANSDKLGRVGLPSDVILNTVRYGGVISMACHGTGIHTRTMPDFVVGLTLVDSKGELQTFTSTSDVWNEVRASFGLIGVIVDITFELDSNLANPYVKVEHSFPVMKSTIPNAEALKELVLGADGIELFWFPLNSANLVDPKWVKRWDPQNDKMWVINFTRVPASAVNGTQLFTYTDTPTFIEKTETQLGSLLNRLSQKIGSLWLQAFAGVFGVLSLQVENQAPWGWLQNGIKTLPAAIHYQKSIDEYQVFDFEVAFPVDEDFGNVLKAWNAAVAVAQTFIRNQSRNPLNVALEARFTRGSLVTMSPAYTSEDSQQLYCWIEVLGGVGTPLDVWLNFVRAVFAAWKSAVAPAPLKLHWAKWNDLTESGQIGPDVFSEQVKAVYKDQIAAFRPKVLGRDPKGVFRNDWLSSLFDLKYQ